MNKWEVRLVRAKASSQQNCPCPHENAFAFIRRTHPDALCIPRRRYACPWAGCPLVPTGRLNNLKLEMHNYSFDAYLCIGIFGCKWANRVVKTHSRMLLIIIRVRCRQKCSHIFGSEEPNLIGRRTKSYCHKNQIFRPEDLTAFF